MLWQRVFRSDRAILLVAIFFGLLVCLIDVVLDTLFFYKGTFWELLITNVPPHEVYIRSVILVSFIIFGTIAAALSAKHRRAAEAHRESERAISTLLSNLPGLAYRCLNDPDWTMLYFSQGVKDLTGYESSELLGNQLQSYGDLIHPDDREAVWRDVQEAFAAGTSFELTYRIFTKSGQEKWVWEQGRQVGQTESGTGILEGFVTDITARTLAEEALREQTERTERLLNATMDGYVLADTEGQLVDVNPAYCRLVGYGRNELLAMNIQRLEARMDEEEVRQRIEQTVQDGSARFETRHHTKNGRIVDLEVSVTVIPSPERTLVASFTRDITARKRAERALRHSEERFRTVFEQAAVGVALMETTTGRFAKVNQKFCDMVGYTAAEMTDTTFQAITHPDDLQEGLDNMQRLVAGEIREFSMEKRYFRKDGSIIWANLTVSATWSPEDEPQFHIAIVQDISEQKRAEDTLRARDAELAHVTRLSTLGEMVASIAHEIRQPLSAIANYATGCQRRLAQNSGENGGIHEAIDRISDQVKLADSIVQRYRGYADPRELHRATINVNDLLDDCLELLGFELRNLGVNARQQFAVPAPTVVGDYTQIYQVVVNLVRNACEAMQQTPLNRREILLSTSNVDQEVEISVGDRGHGLPPEGYNDLLKPFVTTKPDGMGMGLAVSSRIVEAHHGRLWATANATTGATFHFTLPRALEQSEP